MSSRVIQQPNLARTIFPIILPVLVGVVGKLWSNVTGHPADTRILLFAAVTFIFGGFWSWSLSKEAYPITWVKGLYKITAVFHFLLGLAFIGVTIWKLSFKTVSLLLGHLF